MTALPLPGFLKGKNGTLAAIQGQSVGANQTTLTPGTQYDLITLGVFDTWEYVGHFNGFDLHPANGDTENWVGTTDGFELTIGEITPNASDSKLLSAWANFDIIRFEANWLAPGGSTTYKLAVMATRAGGSIRFGLVEEKNGVILTLKPCGIKAYYGTGSPGF
jgi:hypothetical protein